MRIVRAAENIPRLLPPTVWLILAMSLVISLTGLSWGAPALRHPDEFIRVILRMGQQHSLNPHYFNNPVLPIYLGAVLLVPYYGFLSLVRPDLLGALSALPDTVAALHLVPGEFMYTVIVLVRFMSVLASLAGLVVAYLVARSAFGERTAVLATALLALSPLFIPHAKYATVEVYLLLFLWLSLLFQQRFLTGGRHRDLIIAGACAGLATASKYSGISMVLFLAIAVVLKKRAVRPSALLDALFSNEALFAGAAAIVAFLLVNPWPLLAPKEVFSQFEYEGLHKVWTTGVKKVDYRENAPLMRGWIAYPRLAWYALTPPVAVLTLVGLFTAFKRRTQLRTHLLLWVAFYYIALVGPWVTNYQRYLVPVLPALMILTAFALRGPHSSRRASVALAATVCVLLFATLNAALVVREYLQETRTRASAWLDAELPVDASVGYFSQQTVYLPVVPPYANEQYIPFVHNLTLPEEEFRQAADGMSAAGVDYLILTSSDYRRFYGGNPNLRTELYDTLLSGTHPAYEIAAEFSPQALFGYTPPLDDLLSPKITILRRRENIY